MGAPASGVVLVAPRGLGEHLLEVLERTLQLWEEEDPRESWLQDLREMLNADSLRVELMRPQFECDKTVYMDLAFDESCDWFQGAIASLVAVTEGYVEEAVTVRMSVEEAESAMVRAERLGFELRYPVLEMAA